MGIAGALGSNPVTRSVTPDAHSVAVLRGVSENLLRDAESLTDETMDDLAARWRALGIRYVPEECVAIRDAVRDRYVRWLFGRLVDGMNDDPGGAEGLSGSEFSE